MGLSVCVDADAVHLGTLVVEVLVKDLVTDVDRTSFVPSFLPPSTTCSMSLVVVFLCCCDWNCVVDVVVCSNSIPANVGVCLCWLVLFVVCSVANLLLWWR